jgi:tetratricopeptide (TPR) repeat protein
MSKLELMKGNSFFLKGNEYYGTKQYAESTESYEKAIKSYNAAENIEDAEQQLRFARLNLTASLIAQTDYVKAIEEGEKHLPDVEFEKKLIVAYYNLGIEQRDTNLEEAINNFTKAKAISQDIDILYNLGNALIKKGEYTEAKKQFEAIIDIKGEDYKKIMSAYCKLIECKLELTDDINETVDAAKKYFDALIDKTDCSDLGGFVYAHLITQYSKLLKKAKDDGSVENQTTYTEHLAKAVGVFLDMKASITIGTFEDMQVSVAGTLNNDENADYALKILGEQ